MTRVTQLGQVQALAQRVGALEFALREIVRAYGREELCCQLARRALEAGGAAEAGLKEPGSSGGSSTAALPASDVPAGIGPVGEQEGTPSAELRESVAVQAGAGTSQDTPPRPACSAEYHEQLGHSWLAKSWGGRPTYCGGCGERLP